ncbi:terminus macrodomain insulation protein YfbV [Neptunicella sp. SCSIO 80796]|uniref:terminus macrodomain insulation protein YfbV n=1 Tax=Neptunicella plasticusilytica TaxID=3117012 RepID=UPI003A4E1A59
MAQTLSMMFKDGQEYMQIWPEQKELYSLFPECRVIAATKLSIKVMPPMAVAVVALQYNYFGAEQLPQALASGAFLLSLPMQGLLWLGHRAKQVLPPSTIHWYRDIHQKMQVQGCRLQSVKAKPTYKELARLLKTAFDELDKVFTRQWF